MEVIGACCGRINDGAIFDPMEREGLNNCCWAGEPMVRILLACWLMDRCFGSTTSPVSKIRYSKRSAQSMRRAGSFTSMRRISVSTTSGT